MSFPLLIFALVLGIGLIATALLGDGAAKTGARRLSTVRGRHVEGYVDTQVRRITAQRDTRLDQWVLRLLPNPEMLRRRIEATGKSWTLGQYGVACAGLTLGAWLLLATRGLPLLLTLFLGLLIGLGLPHLWVGRLRKKRIAAFVKRFPDAIELLVRGLRSGLPISETLGVVGSEVPGPVGIEFRGVTDKMKIGRTMEGALQDTADRLGTPEFQFFCITLAIQRETGGNLAETLANLADVLRKRMQMKLKVKALSSESKASAYIIGALPFIVFTMILWLNPSYMGKFFIDARLMIAGIGGLVWMAIGALIMAKMINFEI